MTPLQVLAVAFGTYCVYKQGYDNGRIVGRLEAQVYPQFNKKSNDE